MTYKVQQQQPQQSTKSNLNRKVAQKVSRHPSLPPIVLDEKLGKVRDILLKIKESLEIWQGLRGDKKDRVVTFRDLEAAGIQTEEQVIQGAGPTAEERLARIEQDIKNIIYALSDEQYLAEDALAQTPYVDRYEPLQSYVKGAYVFWEGGTYQANQSVAPNEAPSSHPSKWDDARGTVRGSLGDISQVGFRVRQLEQLCATQFGLTWPDDFSQAG